MATQALVGYTLELTEEERAALLRLLTEFLSETLGEKRRTESREYRDLLTHEEVLTRGLVEKMRRLGH